MMIDGCISVRHVSGPRLQLESPWHEAIGIKNCFPAVPYATVFHYDNPIRKISVMSNETFICLREQKLTLHVNIMRRIMRLNGDFDENMMRDKIVGCTRKEVPT